MTEKELFKWLFFLASIVSKGTSYEPKELIGEGYKGFYSAKMRWDQGKAKNLKTYARYRAQGQMRDFIRKDTNQCRKFSERTPFFVPIPSEDDVEKPAEAYEIERSLSAMPEEKDVFAISLLMEALSSLKERDKEIVRLYYWEDLKMAEIATIMGVTEGSISMRLKESRERLKGKFLSLEEDKMKLSQEEWERTKKALKEKPTLKEAAEELSIPVGTLAARKYALKRQGKESKAESSYVFKIPSFSFEGKVKAGERTYEVNFNVKELI